MELLRLINVLLAVARLGDLPRPGARAPASRTSASPSSRRSCPSKEPIDVVRGTLQAALRIQYDGILDVWILDEGDDPDVRAMCRELGVNHFTRKGIEKYNQRKGAFKAKTKHGNYNAWVAEHGDAYEVFLSVDPDHVPLPNYAERHPRLLPRPGRRLRRRPPVLRQRRDVRDARGGVPAVPVPLPDPARRPTATTPRCWWARTTPSASAPCGPSAACPTRSPRTWPPA